MKCDFNIGNTWIAALAAVGSCTMISVAYARGGVIGQLLLLSILNVALLVLVVNLADHGREHLAPRVDSPSRNSADECHEAGLPTALSVSAAAVLAREDAVFQNLAQLRLASISSEIQLMASGQLVFTGSESWRTAYERILRTPGLSRYLSVAWLRTEDYWRDAPGRRSNHYGH